jgi:RNA polymerase sigma-70 factor (ECF subfamily)
VYAFIRRRGYSPEAAEDLSQEFFARVLEHDTLSGARRERGKFRSFLLASLTNFLSNEWDRSQAQKRGGGMTTLSLDFGAGEARYHHEPCHDITPEALFERRWAIAVLDRVLAHLREEHSHKGQAAQFDRLQVFLTGDQDHGSYDDVARSLKLSEGAVRTAVHRLRRRYGELVREEIEGIVGDPGEVEGEIRFLLAALGHE